MAWEVRMRTFNVVSENIEEIAYDDCRSVLRVVFKDGSIYEYVNVPLSVFEAFSKTRSKGKFLHRSIKGRYRFVRRL